MPPCLWNGIGDRSVNTIMYVLGDSLLTITIISSLVHAGVLSESQQIVSVPHASHPIHQVNEGECLQVTIEPMVGQNLVVSTFHGRPRS